MQLAKRPRTESGQVMVLVAVALLALIGSAALVLLAGSVEWQKNQIQELADSTALDSALVIGIGTGCDNAKATAIMVEADRFLATRRNKIGPLTAAAGSCAAGYTSSDTFSGGLSAAYTYPYRAHQQQVEVALTLTLPISFGTEVGVSSTSVIRHAVAQQLNGSVPAVSATTLTCAGGQVNVAGSVIARNLIVRSPATCAIYAHMRYDAASGTYSDLGNVSVYTDGQTWPAGTCIVQSNSGSSSAICADGFELSGHTAAPSCGGATTSYLWAGDKTVNPNPCALLMGPQPVALPSLALPPEPNLDPQATGTLLPAGSVCTAAPGVPYPAIVVGGATVGSGLLPAAQVTKDASGFYHFKPSCYGYLNPGALSGGGGVITNRQIGVKSPVARRTVTPTLPLNSIPGTLLVVTIKLDDSPNKAITAPAGWIGPPPSPLIADQGGIAHTEIWYYPNNPGLISSAAFAISPASLDGIAQMTEWSGVATANPLDVSGTGTVTSNQFSAIISTSASTTSANDLVITDVGLEVQSPQVYTRGAGWLNLVGDMPNGFASDYRLDLPAGPARETPSLSQSTHWTWVIAAFKPAPGAAAGAVLDAGFYYFNGSGYPGGGGGGICLNGATLLAHDVTLEFVNQAGFSSGTCAPGGGASCGSPCQFGSDPAGAGADSPNNFTWFSAPCALPTTGLEVTCPGGGGTGSLWCKNGDRACTDQLIWAPAGTTGQISLTGNNNQAWLRGTISWPSTATCTIQTNGTSTIAGAIACGSLTISSGAGATTSVGGDAGINTALVEAVLIE